MDIYHMKNRRKKDVLENYVKEYLDMVVVVIVQLKERVENIEPVGDKMNE